MKKVRKFLLATLICLTVIFSALGFSSCSSLFENLFREHDETFYYGTSWDGKTCSVIGLYTDSVSEIVIPSSYKNKPVVSIGLKGFYDCDNLTSITIPDSIETINEDAFFSCNSLSNITVSTENANYKSIDGNLYTKDGKTLIKYMPAKSATYFTIPDGVETIGFGAFEGCRNLTSITIPDGVETIEHYAFRSCRNLTSVIIPDSVKMIWRFAFYECRNLINVVIGDGVEEIWTDAFAYCENLVSVSIGSSVNTIEGGAFSYCYKLAEVYNKSSLNIKTEDGRNGGVSRYAKNVYTPTNGQSKLFTEENGYILYVDGEEKSLINYIGDETDLVLPSDLTEINQYAFYEFSKLTSVVIPDGVETIGEHAFSGCNRLKYNEYDNANYLGNENNPYVVLIDAKNETSKIHNQTKVIASSAFTRCSNLTSVIIPNNVKMIGKAAFSYCNGLTNIVIPNSVKKIEAYAFYGCTSLRKVYYQGTAEEWYEISFSSDEDYDLTDATRYYYSETEPATTGNYWHYDENGEAVVW